MVEELSKQGILHNVEQYYSQKLSEFGATSRGVDWNSDESQHIRFKQLLKVLDDEVHEFSLLDYGCGYGALLDSSPLQNLQNNFHYTGFDISETMIAAARSRYEKRKELTFVTNSDALKPHDYTVASGIFSVRQQVPDEAWKAYIIEQLHCLRRLSQKGFACNMLTTYSDQEYMRPQLYYANPCEMFDYCKRHFSKNVALLHDYRLYEFTLIVRFDD